MKVHNLEVPLCTVSEPLHYPRGSRQYNVSLLKLRLSRCHVRTNVIVQVPPPQRRQRKGQEENDPKKTDYTRIWGITRWPMDRIMNKLQQALQKGKAVAGSDELLKGDNGDAGWKLEISTGRLAGTEIQSGVSPVDSAPEKQSSTWCEIQGIMGWMETIGRLLGNQATGNIEAGCDIDTAKEGIHAWLNKNTQ